MAALNILWEEYVKIPFVTRIFATGCVLTTAACALDLVTPYNLYYSPVLVFRNREVWRLITNFFYVSSSFGIDFMFHIYFLINYSVKLEDGSFRDRQIDFAYLMVFGGICMIFLSPLFNISFLGKPLSFMMVYVWSRRNAFARMNLGGFFSFTAPYLPWVLFVFSLLVGGDSVSDLVGIIVGHVYYFLEDVYPKMTPSRRRLLKTPVFFERLFGGGLAHHQEAPIEAEGRPAEAPPAPERPPNDLH